MWKRYIINFYRTQNLAEDRGAGLVRFGAGGCGAFVHDRDELGRPLEFEGSMRVGRVQSREEGVPVREEEGKREEQKGSGSRRGHRLPITRVPQARMQT